MSPAHKATPPLPAWENAENSEGALADKSEKSEGASAGLPDKSENMLISLTDVAEDFHCRRPSNTRKSLPQIKKRDDQLAARREHIRDMGPAGKTSYHGPRIYSAPS